MLLSETIFSPRLTDTLTAETDMFNLLDNSVMFSRLVLFLNDSFRQFRGALVLFLDNMDPCSRFNVRPVSFIHLWPLLSG